MSVQAIIDVVWEISDMVLYNLNKVLNCLHL